MSRFTLHFLPVVSLVLISLFLFTSFCNKNTLDPALIKGKIVVCTIEDFSDNRPEKAEIIKQGGGVGMILIDHNAKEIGFQYVIPSTVIGEGAVQELQAYMRTEK